MLLRPYAGVLIFNGDADSCVPYIGNEEWTTDLAATGVITETEGWRPWYAPTTKNAGGSFAPAGYVTSYAVAGTDLDFSFVTVRLSGHMVPNFTPGAALTFFGRYLAGEAF